MAQHPRQKLSRNRPHRNKLLKSNTPRNRLPQRKLPRHNKLLERFRGKSATIPDFGPMLSKYPIRINPNQAKLGDICNRKVDSLPLSERKRTKLRATKPQIWASYVFPDADVDQLKILSLWGVWLYAWDEEIEDTTGEYSHDLVLGRQFCGDSIDFVEHHLGFGSRGNQSVEPNPLLDPLAIIWDNLRDSYSREQRAALLDETKFYINSTRKEQELRLSDKVPTIQDFLKVRLGSGAVGIVLSLVEYALRIKAPRAANKDPTLKKLWDEANLIVCNFNDIISLQREIPRGQILNVIPLRVARTGDLQNAIDEAFKMVLQGVDRFEELSSQILAQVVPNSVFENETRILIQSYRDVWVGLVRWQ